MNCREAIHRFDALIDGALEPEEVAAVREHLSSCDACADDFREREAAVGLVREIPRPSAPDGFADGVIERLPGRRRSGTLFRLVPLAAAAVLLAVVVLNLSSGPPESEPTFDVAREETKKSPESRKQDLDAEHEEPRGVMPPSEAPAPVEAAEADPASVRVQSDGVIGKASGPTHPPGTASGEPGGFAEADAAGASAPPAPEAVARSVPPDDTPPARSGPAEPGIAGGPPGRKDRGEAGPALKPADTLDAGYAAPTCRILVTGVEPDGAAGRVLAELSARRARGDDEATDRDRRGAEQVLPDADGVPERLLLSLTRLELNYVQRVLERIEGAILKRFNGHFGAKARTVPGKSGPTAAGDEAKSAARETGEELAQRMRVELRFSRAR